jgi:hypothetical protein
MKKLIAATMMLCGAFAANAGISTLAQYDVTDFNGGNGAHGLSTGSSFSNNQFGIDFGKFTILDNNGTLSATFKAEATNSHGFKAVIDLDLSEFEELTSNVQYKVENGKQESAIVENLSDLASELNEDVDYFQVLSGTIEVFDAANISQGIRNMMNCCEPIVFQFGNGANAKNATEFGGSAWINTTQTNVGHWDINVAFNPTQSVSAPATFALVSLTGFVLLRRRLQS